MFQVCAPITTSFQNPKVRSSRFGTLGRETIPEMKLWHSMVHQWKSMTSKLLHVKFFNFTSVIMLFVCWLFPRIEIFREFKNLEKSNCPKSILSNFSSISIEKCNWTRSKPLVHHIASYAWVELPEQISAEQCCFRDFIKFSADQRCFKVGLKNQRWSALFPNCSVLVFFWISAVQRWIKMSWGINKNALCKFGKVFWSQKTCSFGVYQLWKNHSGENSVKNSIWRIHPPPHAPWLHMTCRIVKTLKYKLLITKWTDEDKKLC